MAETDSPEMNCVYVDTNLDTHLIVFLHDHDTIADFKEKLRKDHHQCFPGIGEIDISAVKVKRQNTMGLLLDYHLPDSMFLSMAFEGISHNCWFVSVDAAVRIVDKAELLEKGKEIAKGSLLLDGYTKIQDPETEVAEKTAKKRKLKVSDGEKGRKKLKVDVSQSAAAATTASGFDVDESHELRGDVQVGVVASESSPREKLDDTLAEAKGKGIEVGEKSVEDEGRDKIDTVSHRESHLDTDIGSTARPDTEKKKMRKKRSKDDINQSSAAAITTSRDIVNEIEGVPENVERVDAMPESLPILGVASLDNPFAEASRKEHEMGESSINDVERDQIETDNLASHTENHLDNELTTRPDTEKKKRRKKTSKDNISQSFAANLTTSMDIVNQSAVATTASRFDADESQELRGNVHVEVVAMESSPTEKLDDALKEATTKDIEMGEKSVDDVGREKLETGNRVSHQENHLDTNSDLTTRPDTEKKKKRKKRSKDDINQSSAAAITTSNDIVNETTRVPGNVDSVDATPESLPILRGENLGYPSAEASQKENEMVEKYVEYVGGDQTETDNLMRTHTENHLDTESGLITRPDTEKRLKKRSKDDINQSSAAAITTSRDMVNENNGAPKNIDPVNATPESLPIAPFTESSQKENEIAEKSVEDAGRDNIETNSELTTRPDTEKKKRRKKSSKDDNNQSFATITASGDIVNEINGARGNVDRVDATSEFLSISRRENLGIPSAEASQKETETGEKIDDVVGGEKAKPVAVDNIDTKNIEIDADETKSVKSTKKRKSKKAKNPAEEDTLVVASDAHIVQPIKAVDGEGPDVVIRNVLDSLQEKNETEENLEKTGKKSSKKSKKKHSLKVAESQVMSVNVKNAALEETPPINNTKDTDVSFVTPAKTFTKVADDTEDNSLSKKILTEKADMGMGDNFGCSQNQEKPDQEAGGAKSKKEKKGPHLHPSGSTNGSLSSMKPKEKKSRAQQPATNRLQSRVKNDGNESVRAAAVKSKKQDVKKISSKPLTVEKRKTNFFEDADSSEDEYRKTSDISTKTPSDYSSEDDSDVTFMSRKQGNNLAGGANKFTGSLQDMLRRSSSYKKALIRAQSQPDIDDDSPVDCVPDSQGL